MIAGILKIKCFYVLKHRIFKRYYWSKCNWHIWFKFVLGRLKKSLKFFLLVYVYSISWYCYIIYLYKKEKLILLNSTNYGFDNLLDSSENIYLGISIKYWTSIIILISKDHQMYIKCSIKWTITNIIKNIKEFLSLNFGC